jgi:hypothetical protein
MPMSHGKSKLQSEKEKHLENLFEGAAAEGSEGSTRPAQRLSG